MTGGGGGGTTTQNITQTNAPYGPLQKPLGDLYRTAGRGILGQASTPEFFPGQTFAPFAQETEQALTGTAQRAQAGSPLVGAAQNQLQSTIQGDFLNAGNPYINALAGRIESTVLPSIDARFSQAGRSGSGLHADTLARAFSESLAPSLFGSFENERNRQLQASGGAPGLANVDFQDLQRLGAVGGAREQQEQRGIAEQIARHQQQQQFGTDLGLLQAFAPFLQSQGFGQTSGSQIGPGTQGSNPFLGALGGAASGGSIGAPFGPWGAGIGAGVGGILGLGSTF